MGVGSGVGVVGGVGVEGGGAGGSEGQRRGGGWRWVVFLKRSLSSPWLQHLILKKKQHPWILSQTLL